MIDAWVLDKGSWVRPPMRVRGFIHRTPTALWIYVPNIKRRFMLFTTAFFTERAAWCRWQGNMDRLRVNGFNFYPGARQHMCQQIDGLCQVRVWASDFRKQPENT